MSFRHRKFNSRPFFRGETMLCTVQRNNGDNSVSFVEVPADSGSFPMPEPSEYTLDKLLSAGVPLQSVPSTLIHDDSVLNSIPLTDNNN